MSISSPVADVVLEKTPNTAKPADPALRWLVPLLAVSVFVVILNETIMSVAMPRLMAEFGVPATSVQWLTTAFLLTMAVTIPLSGFFLSRFTLRQVFIGAMATFAGGTLLAAVAPSLEILILARVIQALGTAQLMPLLMTTILQVVPEAERGKTMGTIGIVISVAPAIGPTVSGLILSALSWRWMFWLVLPFAIGSLVLGALWVRNLTQPSRIPVDPFSVLLSIVGFGGLVYGLNSIGEAASGHSAVPVWIPLSTGFAGVALFIGRQLMLRDAALLDLRAFLSPVFSVATLLMAASMVVLFGGLILLPIYLQSVLAVDTLTTGLLLLPGGLIMGLLAPPVGRMYDRFGPRVLLVPGTIVVTIALALMSLLTSSAQLWMVIGVHVTLSIGLAFIFTPVLTSALGALPPHLYSHGSAIVSTVQQVAGAIGTALFVTVMSQVAATGIAAGLPVAAATGQGFTTALTMAAGLSLLAVVPAFFVKRSASTAGHGTVH